MKILILARETDGKASKMTTELMGLACRLAKIAKAEVHAALLASKRLEEVAGELISLGAQKVHIIPQEVFETHQMDLYVQVMDTLIRDIDPDIALFGHDITGRELAPKLAVKIGTGCCMDCIDVEHNLENSGFSGAHPVYGGNAIKYLSSKKRPFLFTIRPRCQEQAEVDNTRIGEIMWVDIRLDGVRPRTEIVGYSKSSAGEVRLEDVKVIVAGGRGLGGPDGFEVLEELALVLGGAVGASRAAVDAGWIDASKQIGLTGKFVSPHLYIAVGISGALQHMTGCAGSKNIVCVNTDPEAPIFKRSHYGVVGDYRLILPKIIPKFRKILNS